MSAPRSQTNTLLRNCLDHPKHTEIGNWADSLEQLDDYSELLTEDERTATLESMDQTLAEAHKALIRIRAVRDAIKKPEDQ